MIGEIRPAWRGLRRSPAFTATAVVTMALGIGAVTGIFSVVNATLLRPLPVPDAGRMVAVGAVRDAEPNVLHGVSMDDVRDLEEQSRAIEAFGAWRDWGFTRQENGEAERVLAALATPELFDVLGVRPALGRSFSPSDNAPDAHRVVLISDAYWRDRFGGGHDVLGRTMVLGRAPRGDEVYTIVGVLPADFALPSFAGVQVWALSSSDPDAGLRRDLRNRRVFARLAPGVGLDEARGEMRVIALRLAEQHPESHRGWSLRLVPLLDFEVGPRGTALRAFFAAVAFVLLIACGNVAMLLLARALARRREFGIRQALGAGRRHVTRVVVAESLMLALAGGALGLALAGWLVRALLVLGPSIPRTDSVPFETGVFIFTLGVSTMAALVLALPAALLSTRVDVVTSLKEESTQSTSSSAGRLRLAIVGGEVALSVVLMAGALVAAQTMSALLSLKLGYQPAGVAVIPLTVPTAGYRDTAAVAGLYRRAMEETASVPGVEAAAVISSGPLFGGSETTSVEIVGRPVASGERLFARFFNVSPGYFDTIGIPLGEGRDFTWADDAGSEAVAIVNETFVRRFLADSEPLGARVRLLADGGEVRIVGVAGDALQELDARAAPQPEIYWPWAQQPRWAAFVVFRAGTDTAVRSVAARLRQIDRAVRVGTPAALERMVEESVRSPRFTMVLLSLFAGVGLILSAVGVYGLVAYTIEQRTREIGVRISLGATSRDVLRAIGTSGVVAVLVGSAAGLAATWASWRLLAAWLTELAPLRPTTLVLAWALLVAAGLLACYVPARRATRIDPALVLRAQ